MIDTVIFDLDGTLLNTLDDLRDAANYSLGLWNMPPRTTDEIRRFVGNGIRKLIERAVPDNTPQDTIDKVLNDFTMYYNVHCNDKTKPYTGIMELLRELKNRHINIGIVTNKINSAAAALNDIYFEGLVDAVYGTDEERPAKPDPYMVNELLNKFNTSAENTLYLGDSQVDIETASNSGIRLIAVLWGFRNKEELKEHGAGTFIENPMELLRFI